MTGTETSRLTHAMLDDLYRELAGPVELNSRGRPRRPRFTMVVSTRTHAVIENIIIRSPWRRARRKAHGGKKT